MILNAMTRFFKDGCSGEGSDPTYLTQSLMYDHVEYMQHKLDILEYNKFRHGDDYFWNVELTAENPDIPRFQKSDDIKEPYNIVVPDSVLEDILHGNAILALNYSREGFTDINWDRLFAAVLPIPKEKIIYITSVYDTTKLEADSGIKCYYTNFWETLLQRICQTGSSYSFTDPDAGWKQFNKQIKLIEQKYNRSKMFTTYNRRPREHRLALLGDLKNKNLLHNAIYSWGGKFETDYDTNTLCRTVNKQFFDGNDESKMYQYLIEINDKIVEHDVSLDINPAFVFNWDHIFNTNFQLITETNADSDSTFLSEKSFKPFASGQPFVMWGDVYTVNALRESGYDTYDHWINHSYDTETDNAKRLQMVIKEVERLCAITESDWLDMLYDMLPTIVKNNRNFMNSNSRCIQNNSHTL